MYTLEHLHNDIAQKLGHNDFELDTGEQSFVVYPTNHINLISEFLSINVGDIIYGNVTKYTTIIDNIKNIYQACKSFVDETGEYIQIIYFPSSSVYPYKIVFGGMGEHDQVDEYFTSVNEMIHFINNFEFEEI